MTAAEQILLGNADVALAGGAENMSRAGHLLTGSRAGVKMGEAAAVDMMTGALHDPFGHGHMGVTAENVAAREGIGRAEQDAFAARSHRLATRAIAEGRFAGQILPLTVRKGRGEAVFDTDEHVRPDVTEAGLAALRPVFRREGGTVTAGNASGINDGAAALVLAEAGVAAARGLAPLARIRAYGLGGVAPEVMGMGPVPAVKQALARAGLSVGDLDVIESNEAFAAQARETRLDHLELFAPQMPALPRVGVEASDANACAICCKIAFERC